MTILKKSLFGLLLLGVRLVAMDLSLSRAMSYDDHNKLKNIYSQINYGMRCSLSSMEALRQERKLFDSMQYERYLLILGEKSLEMFYEKKFPLRRVLQKLDDIKDFMPKALVNKFNETQTLVSSLIIIKKNKMKVDGNEVENVIKTETQKITNSVGVLYDLFKKQEKRLLDHGAIIHRTTCLVDKCYDDLNNLKRAQQERLLDHESIIQRVTCLVDGRCDNPNNVKKKRILKAMQPFTSKFLYSAEKKSTRRK